MKARLLDFLRLELWGNPALSWAIAAGVATACFAAVVGVRWLLLRRRAARSESPERAVRAVFFDLVQGIRLPFALIAALWAGSLLLRLPDRVSQIARTAAVLVLLGQGVLWARALVGQVFGWYRRKKIAEDPGAATTLGFVQFVVDAAMLTLVTMVVLDNLGVNITALVAGLGIGGIAIAMAAQTVLSDLFASLSIMLDQPFRVGDFIIVGDAMGSVERVGVKSTLLRCPSGESLIFSNGDLLRSRIRNLGRIQERRVELVIGASIATPAEKVELVPTLLREAVEAQARARFERAHLKEVGSCLSFEAVYHVRDSAYGAYMDVQEAVNLAVVRRFQEEQIEFASPTRTAYVAQGVAPVRW